MKQTIHIGTSGWYYSHWIGPFYPPHFKPKDFLNFYMRYFDSVELNNPFYHLPDKKIFGHWRKQANMDFIFSVKASRFITHSKRLNDPKSSVKKFFQATVGLGEKLGPILFQLPPRFHYDFDRLQRNKKIIYCYFDNTQQLHAVTNALRLQTLCDSVL